MALTARLSVAALRELSHRLGIRLPAVVDVQPVSVGSEADLRRSGWLDERGEVDDRLAAALRALVQPKQAVDVLAYVDRHVRTVLAANERRGVQVTVTGEKAVVRRIVPIDLSAQAVRQLPDTPAGYGRSTNIPTQILQAATTAAGKDLQRLESELRQKGIPADTAHMIAVMNRHPVNTAQFGVTITRKGRAHRGDHVVGWWANDTGGYLAEEHRSLSGESWTTIAPADIPRLTQQIERRLTDLEQRS
jgi:hypothetical protein